MRDLLYEAIEGILAHKARSLLSTLGILFGVAAVIGILSIGEGARQEQQLLIEQLGILNFQLTPTELPEDAEQLKERLRASQGISQRDVEALRSALPDARNVGGMRLLEGQEMVPVPPDEARIRIMGAEPGYLAATDLQLREGRPLTQGDEDHRAMVCLVGANVARALFGTEPAMGQRVRVGEVWLRVVGVVATPIITNRDAIDGVDISDRSWDLILPLQTVLHRWDHDELEPELSEIQVALSAEDQVRGHSRLAQRILERLHRGQQDVTLVVPLQLLEQSRAQQQIFNLVMGLIAGISLLVGGIGIMNIMLASVLERTREIGVRLAVGATPADIRLLFIAEAALISLVGGLLGIGVGVFISSMVAHFTGWATEVSIEAVLVATVVSTAEGIIFGFIPAQRAARLAPVLALRGT